MRCGSTCVLWDSLSVVDSPHLQGDMHCPIDQPTTDDEHTYPQQILRVSRCCVVGFGLVMGALAALLEVVGLQLG